MHEDTTVTLAHDEAVYLATVLDWLRDWLVAGGEAYKLLDAHLGVKPGALRRHYADGVLECVTVYSGKLSERVQAAIDAA